jgi:mannose-1-phosphate guanylyltransferase / mannose-6-phosphate isomerase
MRRIMPVVLSGGSGTRLWPASRTCYPKQFLALHGERSLLQNTLLRFAPQEDFDPPLVVGSEEHRFLIGAQAQECGAALGALLVEPVARDTAPAIAAAAAWLAARDPDAVMLVMPADHLIGDPVALAEAVRAAMPAAEAGWLVTFGIRPTSPETGYGYVEEGGREIEGSVRQVERFVEKPDLETARRFVESGRHLWNSGLFLFRAATLLAEMERHAPGVHRAALAAVAESTRDLDFVRLARAAFETSPSISIDYGLMQKSDRVAVRPVADLGWSDIGSWNALYEASAPDGRGNVAVGEALLVDCERNYAYLPDGVEDLIIVSTPDALLVTRRDLAQDLKPVVERLRAERPEQVSGNRRMYRPWGHYETLDLGGRHQVKHIFVKPGGRLSLQKHYHRAEHWVVVKGTARVTRDNEVHELTENESIYLPLGCRHRLENPGRIPLSLIEVQTGSYLGEDDIERFEDLYGRG